MFSDDKLDMVEYSNYLKSDDYRKQQIEKLADNYRILKTIEMENKSILCSFTDHEKNREIQGAVTKVWNGVLENNTEENTIDEIVAMSLETEELINLLLDNKNKGYFPSGKLFDNFVQHPVQKQLTKDKYLSKRAAKKSKTPMQTIKYVYSAKTNSDRDARLAKIEKSLADAHHMISLLAVNQLDIGEKIMEHSEEIDLVKVRLNMVKDKIKDNRKLKLYALYTSDKKSTHSELAAELGVGLRTVNNWIKELREMGVIEYKLPK